MSDEPGNGGYAFVQVGSFSGVNAILVRHLDERLGLRADVIDVVEPRRLSRAVALNGPWSNLPALLAEQRGRALRDPRRAIRYRQGTAHMFRWYSERAHRGLAALAPRFVFQTQTLFDASLPSLPFVIFTDHTARANQRYGMRSSLTHSARYLKLEAQAYRRADRILTTSEFARSSLLEDYGCAPESVVTVGSAPNVRTPDVGGETPAGERGDDPGTILFVGRDWERKGGRTLLEAFARVRAGYPDVQLRIVGCSPEVALAGVTVVGLISSEQVAEEYRRADIFCLPSWIEPSAVAYLEAARFGLPVVGTRAGGTPERVLDGVSGLLCDPGDAEGLAATLGALLADPERAREMGRAGREFAAQFTWPAVADRIGEELRALGVLAG